MQAPAIFSDDVNITDAFLPPVSVTTIDKGQQNVFHANSQTAVENAATSAAVEGPPRTQRTADELSVFAPLKSKKRTIRILELLPGIPRSKIEANLIEHSIKDNVTYEALSYTWGEPNWRSSILLNSTNFRISENLEQCLQHLRFEGKSRLLWIDAICINQEDIAEQSHQVQLMGQVYSRATGVVVWMDMEIDSSAPAFEKLCTFSQFTDIGENASIWFPLADFFNHPYWRRVWIQQELALSKRYEINCRGSIIPGKPISEFIRAARGSALIQPFKNSKDFDVLASLVGALEEFPSKDLWRFKQHIDRKSSTKLLVRVLENSERFIHQARSQNRNELVSEDCRLLRCLIDFRNSLHCSEPRDRVYGILSLVSDCNVEDISIDYSRPVVDIYVDTLRHIYHQYHSLDFLCAVGVTRTHHQNPHNLPSWTPDWNSSSYTNTLLKPEKEYRASGTLVPLSHPFSVDGKILTVQGMRIGKVICSIQSERERKPIAWYVAAWLKIIKAVEELLDVDQGLSWFAERLVKVMGAVQLGATDLCNRETAVQDVMMFFLKGITEPYCNMELDEFVQQTCGSVDTFQKVYFYMDTVLKRHEVFLSDKGWLGLVPEGIVVDSDEIWIIFGCSMPMLLRPHDGYYTSVSPVAVPGFMRGEAVKTVPNRRHEGSLYGGYTVKTIALR